MSQIQKIHNYLIESGKTLALAESCTGGFLASKFTAIPDASLYFLGSLVVYSNQLKHSLLKVSSKTLLESGAVSRETATEMVLGLMKETSSDYVIATTGIAGPSGGTQEKPVGTVFIAFAEKGKKPHVIEAHFQGNRQEIINATCEKTLNEFQIFLSI